MNNSDWTNGADGEIKKGTITDTVYVFDASTWRVADDIEKTLGGCVAAIQDSVGKVGNTYYICDPRKWKVATTLQYDTYRQECTKDGKMFYGNINTAIKYVCDNSVFRTANKIEIEADSACTSYNRNEYYILPKYDGKNNYSYYKCTEKGWTFTTEKLNQGSMIDERDGHEYKTIGIKSQMWMAENLNYADSVNYPSMLGRNWCLEDVDSCALFGRYYTWSAAIDSVYWAKQEKKCGYAEKPCGLSEKVKGICSEGWHLPSDDEISMLFDAVGGSSTAGLVLKSTFGWKKWSTDCGNGTDAYGFSGLSVGWWDRNKGERGNEYVGESVSYWRISEYDSDHALYWGLRYYNNDAYVSATSYQSKWIGNSVRCIKDEE